MGGLDDHVAAFVGRDPVSLRQALRYARMHGEVSFVRDAARAALIRAQAASRGIAASDEDLQRAADRFRARKGLHGARETREWLTANGMTVEDLEARMEDEVLASLMRVAVSQDRVESYFREHQDWFQAATLAKIVVADEGIAAELRLIITEEGEDFGAMAEKYSVDPESRVNGGLIGVVPRFQMPEAVASAVFAAGPGDVVGPIPVGATWDVIQIRELHPATLDIVTRDAIASLVFDEWLEAEERRSVRIPLLEEI